MSQLLALLSTIGGGQTVTTTGWNNIGPGTGPLANTNVTLGGSGTDQCTITSSGAGIIEYDLDGAGFTDYLGAFAVSAGETLRWQVSSLIGTASGTIEVFFDGVSVDSFTYNVSA